MGGQPLITEESLCGQTLHDIIEMTTSGEMFKHKFKIICEQNYFRSRFWIGRLAIACSTINRSSNST